jgi:hypothetical protein
MPVAADAAVASSASDVATASRIFIWFSFELGWRKLGQKMVTKAVIEQATRARATCL